MSSVTWEYHDNKFDKIDGFVYLKKKGKMDLKLQDELEVYYYYETFWVNDF